MRCFVVFVAIIGVASAGQRHGGFSGGFGGGHSGGEENYGPPQPYEFGYTSQDAEGTHGHSQSSDGRRVQGHYVIQGADGRNRKVEYHADENGFHAKIITNELGTESKDAADAIYQSSAITGEQASLQHGSGPSKFGGSGGFKASGFGGGHGSSFGGSHRSTYSSSSKW